MLKGPLCNELQKRTVPSENGKNGSMQGRKPIQRHCRCDKFAVVGEWRWLRMWNGDEASDALNIEGSFDVGPPASWPSPELSVAGST
jgi:hypothetical protein